MRLETILASAFVAIISQVSALEARPQQTAYSPSLSDYALARKAANEAQAGYRPASGQVSSPYGSLTGTQGFSPAPYGSTTGPPQGNLPVSNRYIGTSKYPSNVVAAQVVPNNAATTGQPDEELLGPFSGIAGQIESSIESSLLGKVTSLPASELTRVESSIQAKESSILGISSLNLTSASATATSDSPHATGHSEVVGKETSRGGSGEKKSAAAATLLWENGHIVAVGVIGLAIWFA